MHIPVHSPRLPGYINVMQIILIILTMAGLFPDIPHIILFDVIQNGIAFLISFSLVWDLYIYIYFFLQQISVY